MGAACVNGCVSWPCRCHLRQQDVCPSCDQRAELVDDGQGLGLLICENYKAVSDILDRTPFWKWPGNDLPFEQAMGQSLKDWMRGERLLRDRQRRGQDPARARRHPQEAGRG
jgi:hypothetical protein